MSQQDPKKVFEGLSEFKKFAICMHYELNYRLKFRGMAVDECLAAMVEGYKSFLTMEGLANMVELSEKDAERVYDNATFSRGHYGRFANILHGAPEERNRKRVTKPARRRP